MGEPTQLDGYTITGIAGIGGSGTVQRGIGTDQVPVAIRRVPGSAAAGVRGRAGPALAVHHRGIASVREVLTLPEGAVAVISEFVPGPTLATLRAARRGLSLPECVQVATELFAALAAWHAGGLIHGDVSPSNAIVTPTAEGEGRVVLVDLLHAPGSDQGTRGFRAPELARGAAASATADVYAAARLCLWAAAPEVREEVSALLAPMLAAEASRRPLAHQAAAMLDGVAHRAIGMAPMEVLASATLREHAAREPTTRARVRRPRTRHRHRAARRRVVLRAGVALVLLLGLCGGAVAWAGPGGGLGGLSRAGAAPEQHHATPEAPGQDSLAGSPTAAEPSATGTGAGSDREPAATEAAGPGASTGLRAAVRSLIADRDRALSAGDAAELAALTAPGTPLAAADAALLTGLSDSGVRLAGYRTEVLEVDVLSLHGHDAEVRLQLRQLEHRRTTSAGTTLVPAMPARCVQLTLQHEATGWLAVERAACP